MDIKQKIEAAKSTSDIAELKVFASDAFVYVRESVAINPAAPFPPEKVLATSCYAHGGRIH